MALSKDVFVNRWGAEGKHEPAAAPLGSAVTVYSGSIALSRAGYLANAASPASTDVVLGLVGDPAGGTYVKTGPGIVGNGAQGANGVWVEVLTGSFILLSATGADQLDETTVGSNVYVVDEVTVGKTTGGGTRPLAGVQMPIDPTIPSGYVPVQFTNRGT
jgi:hypothetical protein